RFGRPDRFLPVLEEIYAADAHDVAHVPESERLLREVEGERPKAGCELRFVSLDPFFAGQVQVEGKPEYECAPERHQPPARAPNIYRGPRGERGYRQESDRSEKKDAQPGLF